MLPLRQLLSFLLFPNLHSQLLIFLEQFPVRLPLICDVSGVLATPPQTKWFFSFKSTLEKLYSAINYDSSDGERIKHNTPLADGFRTGVLDFRPRPPKEPQA